jgi:hypothetical protein
MSGMCGWPRRAWQQETGPLKEFADTYEKEEVKRIDREVGIWRSYGLKVRWKVLGVHTFERDLW